MIRGELDFTRRTMSKASFAGGVERFARADVGLAVTHEHWDCDAFLLGTPDGTVDLRSGELRAANPEDRITKVTACAPREKAECPLWRQFLKEATRENEELTTFLQRLSGYCLTGDIREHLLVFIYGDGGNGKSVFSNVITSVMGDYAVTAAMDTFTASDHERHPTDLAMLRGARLVTAAETDKGRFWSEQRIKQMTGGDPITARFMRQDFFTYKPAFKPVIIGNHQPQLRNVLEALRRRIAIVPFTNKPAKPDKELESKLREEWPGILRWMVDGCVAWQKEGLPRPDVVKVATDEYFEEQDLFGQWIAERLEAIPVGVGQNHTPSAVLFYNWDQFARAAGEDPGTRKGFGEAMKRRGYKATKDRTGRRVWLQVRVRS
jgi:putative DNA primase/helicase